MSFALLRASQTSYQIPIIPEIPINYEQSFTGIAPFSPGLTPVTPALGNTSL